MSEKLVQTEVEAIKAQLKAMQPLVKKLATVDKSKLDESKDKFLVIRMTRLEHLIRETLSGDSLRK